MSKVTSEVSMSLDGFITEPNERAGNPLGDDPGRLHDWMFDAKTEADAKIVDELYASTGAVLIGKRMFDAGFEPWGDPPPFGMPVFVLTHEAREPQPMQGGTTYNFVTGIEAALEQARAAAGDKNVSIWGGANIIMQYLKAGSSMRWRFTSSQSCSAEASACSRISLRSHSNSEGSDASRPRARRTSASR
jgi:dihydrofolate reductase